MRCSLQGPIRPAKRWRHSKARRRVSVYDRGRGGGYASQNCGHLADDFRVGAILELARGEGPVRKGMYDDESSFEGTTAAEIATIPGEKNVKRTFPKGCLSR